MGRGEGGGFRMGNTCMPVEDSFRYMAEPIQYCKVKKKKKESLRGNGIAIIVNKRVQNAVLGCNLKNDRMISAHFQDKPKER